MNIANLFPFNVVYYENLLAHFDRDTLRMLKYTNQNQEFWIAMCEVCR